MGVSCNPLQIHLLSFYMTVNLPLPQKAELKPVKGFQMGIAEAGIKKANRKDLLVMTLAPGSRWQEFLP